MPQQLEPARPAYLLKAGADGAVGDVPSPAPQHTEGRDGEGGVFRLIAADEGQTDTVQPVEIEGDGVEVAALHFEAGEIHTVRGAFCSLATRAMTASASGTPP